jgi:hypothetical protein
MLWRQEAEAAGMAKGKKNEMNIAADMLYSLLTFLWRQEAEAAGMAKGKKNEPPKKKTQFELAQMAEEEKKKAQAKPKQASSRLV